MRYGLTILNAVSALFIIGVFVYTMINYTQLSASGGWGLMFMFVFGAIAVVALIVDLILQQFIKDKQLLNITGAIFAMLIAALLIFID